MQRSSEIGLFPVRVQTAHSATGPVDDPLESSWAISRVVFRNEDTATLNQYLREQGLVDMKDFIEIQIKAKEDRTKFHQDMLQLFRQKFVSEDGKIVLKKDNDE
jgi:DNA polymerase II large subunit